MITDNLLMKKRMYLSFCLDFLVISKNCLIKKIRLISKIMVTQPVKQIIAILTIKFQVEGFRNKLKLRPLAFASYKTV